MTTPCSLSLLLRQNPAVQWCGCSRGSWVQTPLPTLKWEQAAPCCPADVDAEGTSHGLRIPQPTRVAMAPEGDVGLGWSPQQLGGLVPARQAHIRAPTPSENAASAARVSAGEPVDMATPCGGSARPRVPPASPRSLEPPGAPPGVALGHSRVTTRLVAGVGEMQQNATRGEKTTLAFPCAARLCISIQIPELCVPAGSSLKR